MREETVLFSGGVGGRTKLWYGLENYSHNTDGYHGFINWLMTFLSFWLFAFSSPVSEWNFIEQINVTAYAFCRIHWALAEGIIWAYWIHRSLLLAGGFKVSLIFRFWRSTELLSRSFCIITALFLGWKATLLEILNIVFLCADFETCQQCFSFVSEEYNSLKCNYFQSWCCVLTGMQSMHWSRFPQACYVLM